MKRYILGALLTLLLFVATVASLLVRLPVFAAIGGPININAPVTLTGTTNTITAPKFMDTADTAYYIDPAGTTSLVTAGSIGIGGKIGIGTTAPGNYFYIWPTPDVALSGTVSCDGSTTITGTSTSFTTELEPGVAIKVGNNTMLVSSIASDTSLVTYWDNCTTQSGSTMYRTPKQAFVLNSGENFQNFAITNTGRIGIGTTAPNDAIAIFTDFSHGPGQGISISQSGVNRRMVSIQSTSETANAYTRSVIGSSLSWNPRTDLWQIHNTGGDPYNDFAAMMFRNAGPIWFVNGTDTSCYVDAGNTCVDKIVTKTDAQMVPEARMSITNTGLVGIGTTNPATNLDIDTGSNSQGLRLRGLAETTEIGDIYVSAGGSLVLSTVNTGAASAFIEADAEDDGFGFIIRDSSTGSTVYTNLYMNDATIDYLNIVVGAANTTTGLVVQSGGNVGVGTTAPGAILEIFNNYAPSVPSLKFHYTDPTDYAMAISPYVVGGGNVGYRFTTNNGASSVDAFAITGAGNVGVGTTAPTTSLMVNGGVTLIPATAAITSDNQLVTIGNRSFIQFTSNDLASTNRTFCLTGGFAIGQILILQAPETNEIELNDGSESCSDTVITQLSAIWPAATGQPNDTLTLIWNGTTWIEIARGTN